MGTPQNIPFNPNATWQRPMDPVVSKLVKKKKAPKTHLVVYRLFGKSIQHQKEENIGTTT